MEFQSPAFENFRLFASVEDEKSNPGLGIGFLDSQQPSLPPPPPCLEVISSEVSFCVALFFLLVGLKLECPMISSNYLLLRQRVLDHVVIPVFMSIIL